MSMPPSEQPSRRRPSIQWRAHLARVVAAAQRVGRFLARTAVRVALLARAVALRAWRSDLKRRILRPLLVSTRVLAAAALLAAVTILAGGAFVRRVPPTDLVVRQNNWGTSAGVAAGDLEPGFHLGAPGRTSWHVIDARTSYLRYGPPQEGHPFPPLELRTADDLELSLAVTVPFRIREGEAHLVVADGLKSTYKQNAKTAVERVLLERFAELRSEEWFSTERRNAIAASALEAIQAALAPIHVEADAVYVTGAEFPSLYESKIAEQQLGGQKLETAEVLARRDLRKHEISVEEAALDRAEAELAAEFDLELERLRLDFEERILDVRTAAESYRTERKVLADNTFVKSVATGELAVAQAEALRDRLTNEALETTGGRLMLAQEAASAIRFKTVRLDANNPASPNVLDLDSFVALLVGDLVGRQ